MHKFLRTSALYISIAFLIVELPLGIWDFITNYWPQFADAHATSCENWIDVSASWRIVLYFLTPLLLWILDMYFMLRRRYMSELRTSLKCVSGLTICFLLAAVAATALLNEFNVYVRALGLATLVMLWLNLLWTTRSLYHWLHRGAHHHHGHHHHHHHHHSHHH